MSKGLEALKEVHLAFNEANHPFNLDLANKHGKALDQVEKELKALEIIKDLCGLKVYKNKLGQCFLEGTNILFPIPQKTYDLLKEVLK